MIRAALDAGVGLCRPGRQQGPRRRDPRLGSTLTDAERRRVHTPSACRSARRRPSEIAVSILAEVIRAVRSRGRDRARTATLTACASERRSMPRSPMTGALFADVDEVIGRFDAQDYLLDVGTASAIYLAVVLGRPLLAGGRTRRRQDHCGENPCSRARCTAAAACSATRA